MSKNVGIKTMSTLIDDTAQIICQEDREEFQRLGFTPEEISRVEEFFVPFCITARTYLARVFVRARVKRKDFGQTLLVCQDYWNKVWRHGTPERIGDTDDVAKDSVGIRNTMAFFQVYESLGLPRPKMLN